MHSFFLSHSVKQNIPLLKFHNKSLSSPADLKKEDALILSFNDVRQTA